MSYPVKLVNLITPIALAISLAACGGDGSFGDKLTGTETPTPTTPENPDGVISAYLDVQASSKQLFSSGSSPVILSAVVKDIGNNIIKDAGVSFSVDNGATLEDDISQGSIITKKLSSGFGDKAKENRTLTVVVTSGSLSKTMEIDVVGTDLNIQGPASTAIDKPVEFFIKLADSDGNGVTDQLVEVVSEKGYTVVPKNGLEFRTDTNGDLPIIYTALDYGTDVVRISALGADASTEVSISSNDFVINSSNNEVSVNVDETINLQWVIDGTPQSFKNISIRSTRGKVSPSIVTTDGNGKTSFVINSETAGFTIVSAENDSGLITSLEREFVATTPHYLNTVLSPSVISLLEKSTIITSVRDVNDNPVKNQRVIFSLKDTVGGSLNNSIAVTDSYGRAEVNYTAGLSSSAKDGVIIDSYLESNTALGQKVYLTVGGEALRLVVGMDNKVEIVDKAFYKTKVGVIVTDSAGAPLTNQKVDFSLIPTHYRKGRIEPKYEIVDDSSYVLGYYKNYTGWGYLDGTVNCPSEDLDNDGNKDDGEDINNNGKLDPTHTATISAGEGTTDSEGKLTVDVIYPKSQAWWTTLLLTATVKVAGSEFVENVKITLPVAQTEVNHVDANPVNEFSPFGAVQNDCMNPN